jgi:formylglycine-generating enzyme required for sulfatase activity
VCALAVAAVLAVVGCEGTAGASSTYQPGLSHGTYLLVSLVDGAVTTAVADPGLGGPTRLVLRHVGAQFLGVTEVTKGQWQTVMGSQPWSTVPTEVCPAASADDVLQPACAISREQAVLFTVRVSGLSGLPLSLPSLATYQALSGALAFPWGDASDVATVGRYASVRETAARVGVLHEVGVAEPTGGFYDLIGNVREWTADDGAYGGSSLDNLAAIQAMPVITTVAPVIAHPLYGLRIACPAGP